MADFDISINLKAHDLGSAAVISGMRGNLRGLGKDINANLGRSGQGGRALQQFGAGLSTVGASVSTFARAGRGILDPIIKAGSDFERSMAEVLAFGGSKFAPFMDELSGQARQLGRDTEFTALQAGASMRQLAQAGLDPAQIMGALPTVMDLAKAGAMDLAPAAKIVASTMAQFGMETSEAASAADILAKTANSTQTNVGEIGKALQMSGTSADLLGFSLEQTSVILAGLGKTAVTSGRAGRTLDSVFLGLSRLTNPSLRKGLKEIGIDQKALIDNLSHQDMGAILGQFREGFEAKGLGGVENAARRMEIITKIFGKIGARGFLALSKTAESGKLAELSTDIHEYNGAAKEMGDIMSDTMEGSTKRAESALSELSLTVADELLPALRPLLDDVTDLVKQFAAWAKENPDTVREMATLAVKLVAVATVVGPLVSTAGSLVTVMHALGVVSGATGKGGLLAAYKAVNKLSPAVSNLAGTASGKLGMFGAVAGAAALGVAFGMWADETFGISDNLSGLNTEMDIHNRLLAEGLSLQVGLSRVRGSATLESLSEGDRALMQKAQAEKERLAGELSRSGMFDEVALTRVIGKVTGLSDGRGSAQIGDDIQRQQAIIDKLNAKGLKADQTRAAQTERADAARLVGPQRPSNPRAGETLGNEINQSHFGKHGEAAVRIIVDQDNRLIGVQGLDSTGAGTGDIVEGM